MHAKRWMYTLILIGVKGNATNKNATLVVHMFSKYIFCSFIYFTDLLSKLAQQQNF
jgi:hypothetical protein